MATDNTLAPEDKPVLQAPPPDERTAHPGKTRIHASPEGFRDEAVFFTRCGIGKPDIKTAWDAALRNATSIERELIAARRLDPDIYYRFLAEHLGLGFAERIDAAQVIRLENQEVLLYRLGPLKIQSNDRIVTVLAPEARDLARLRNQIARYPELRTSLVIATPQTVRDAVWAAGAIERVQATTRSLAEAASLSSARHVLTGRQGFILGCALSLIVWFGLVWPWLTLDGLHLVFSSLFFGNIVLRLAAIAYKRPPRPPGLADLPRDGLPVYTVLVALRDEAAMAGQLVAAMTRLDWPKSLLDIKFICEADDHSTIVALKACKPGSECEVVIVPPFGPMTKPKALQYALQGARGSYVAVYDAEDMPHPAQLREAYAEFGRSDARLACVQAPLAIANNGRNWITALFAVEYAGLFRVLIPFLGRFDLPILLGGTSNHFRRDALVEVGGWDPYNVTEDADLGMRLYRNGYRTKAICRATVESAPDTLPVWIRQRSRWHKGWTQTWLVVMREPVSLARQLGLAGFITFQLLLAGMLVSAALHPVIVLFLLSSIYWLWQGAAAFGWSLSACLFAVDLFNVTASYMAFVALGWRGMVPAEKARIKRRWLALLPAYWVAMSWAAWRAVWQLPFKPHLWEKTPHPAHGSIEHSVKTLERAVV